MYQHSGSLLLKKAVLHKAVLFTFGNNTGVMKKNLLDKDSVEKLIGRVQNLRQDSAPLWGSMTATEMLVHCNKVHQHLLLPTTSTNKKTSLKQYLIRWMALYVMPHFPKNAKAPKGFETRGTVTDAAFEEQKQFFIQLASRFSQHKAPIQHHHPYFGNLSTTQWGLSAWKHADHHLRQFGV